MIETEFDWSIIAPHEYVTTPWKNGKGETTELAISEGGSLEDFDWRLSIASVVEDGEFSDFSGYLRNLILIDGRGLALTHDDAEEVVLKQLLDFDTFDGASKTIGRLADGPIKDLNLMTKADKYQVTISTHLELETVLLKQAHWIFILGLEGALKVSSELADLNLELAHQHLLKINMPSLREVAEPLVTVSGAKMIIIQLNPAEG